eukprot:scaffold96225_cov63-Phaeocystis_antarctica.AAC.1
MARSPCTPLAHASSAMLKESSDGRTFSSSIWSSSASACRQRPLGASERSAALYESTLRRWPSSPISRSRRSAAPGSRAAAHAPMATLYEAERGTSLCSRSSPSSCSARSHCCPVAAAQMAACTRGSLSCTASGLSSKVCSACSHLPASLSAVTAAVYVK